MLKEAEIKKLINDDAQSPAKKNAKVGQRYYEAEHDILKYRMFYYNADGDLVEDKYRSNSRISHPFFTELTEQLAAYILSSPANSITSENQELQNRLDDYFDDNFWSETSDLIVGAYSKGWEYLYGFQNEKNRIEFQCADSLGVIEVKEKDTDTKCECIIYWYVERIEKGKKEIKKILVVDDKEIAYYCQSGTGPVKLDDSHEINPNPHIVYSKNGEKYGKSYEFIPFWRLDNNKKRQSGLKPIKGIIDDYDIMQCGLSNNLKDFDTPVYVVKGFEGDDLNELQTNLKTKKIVGVDDEGGIEVNTVDIPFEARKQKADDDEKNIYRFGMGVNTIGLKDTSATTNIAIKMAYTLLELKAKKLEGRIKSILKEIVQVVLNEINARDGKDYQLKDITFDFTHETIVNEKENAEIEKIVAETQQIIITTLLSAANYLDDESVVKAICEALDINYEDIKDKLPALDDISEAKVALGGGSNSRENIDSRAVKSEAEGSIGKALNGAQTASLLSIIAQWKQGTLSENEAISIISVSIGITEERARKLLQLDSVK